MTSYALMPLGLWLLFSRRELRGWTGRLVFVGEIALVVWLQSVLVQFPPDRVGRGWEHGIVGGAKLWWPNYNPVGFFAIFAIGVLAAGVQVRLGALRSLWFDGLALVGLGLASCATAPQVYQVENRVTLNTSKEVAWTRLVEFFASNNLSIKTIEKASGIIAAERMMASPMRGGKIGTWADCGSELLMTPVSQTVDLNVFVREVTADQVQVTVNTRFQEVRQFDATTQRVDCNSTGALEAAILSAIRG